MKDMASNMIYRSSHNETGRTLAPVRSRAVTSITLASLCALILGMLFHVAAYGSIQPIVIGLLFLVSVMFLLSLKGISGREERRAYLLVYSIGWFWAGIAALYANFLGDPFQLTNDAAVFYNDSISGTYSVNSLLPGSAFEENVLATLIWQFFYDLFAAIGFEKGRYIGIAVNITFVALTAVVGSRMLKIVFGRDEARIRRFTLAFAFCGVFWLFGAIHIRDAAILLAVTLLSYFWVRYLANLRISNLLRLGVATSAALMTFNFLRTEFRFVPAAMIMAGFAALLVTKKNRGGRVKLLLAVLVMLTVAAYFVLTMRGDLSNALMYGNESYTALSMEETGAADSLGNAFVTNQPLPVRLMAGFVYMLIFPIPFWVGFQLKSTYYLFKSFHVIFMYALTPLFALGVLRVIKSHLLRTPPILFLLFSFVGFTFSVAITSLETRHIGDFLPLLLVFAMVPDLTSTRDRLAYRNLLALFISAMVLVHLAWAVMKFG